MHRKMNYICKTNDHRNFRVWSLIQATNDLLNYIMRIVHLQVVSNITAEEKVNYTGFIFMAATKSTSINFGTIKAFHYNDVIMGAIASQITSLTIVYSTVYSGADQRKHQSSASLSFMRGIHRGKCFHLMTSSCKQIYKYLISCKRYIKQGFPLPTFIEFCPCYKSPHGWQVQC